VIPEVAGHFDVAGRSWLLGYTTDRRPSRAPSPPDRARRNVGTNPEVLSKNRIV